MLPKSSRKSIRRIVGKELTLFFSSPVAYLFLAAFAGASLFIVFWGEAFFARNIADARPLFEWMPILLIFLCSTLTMRMWSEERRTGTLEHILTLPVPTWNFVVGKFLACLFLLCCALLTTLAFPLSVSILGDLDWGPVAAGYLATVLLGATYLSIGLFVSSRSANQIVSLLTSVALCGVLFLVGSPLLTNLVGFDMAELLKLLGSGSRFESITRGIFDLRDVAYYIGIILTFLSLNAFCLESERWSQKKSSENRGNWKVVLTLIMANAIGLNLWMGQISWLRADLTEGRVFSLSEATENQLDELAEPLVIKAFFSQKTHPLLAPLVPQIKDLLREYAAVSKSHIRVEFLDPKENPEAEREAREEFGLQPMPFQVSDRYEASIVSSYFNIVVKYGDSYEVLGFKDLIEVKGGNAKNLDVQLRNPEYDITRAIKKAVDNFQKQGKIFDTLKEPVTLQVLWSPKENLPEKLGEYRDVVESAIEEWKGKAGDRLRVELYDPDTEQQGKRLVEKYGLKPMTSSLASSNRFYFYLVIGQGDRLMQLPLSNLDKASFDRGFEQALKRFGSGFAKTVGLVSGNGLQTKQLQSFLGEELNIQVESLKDGNVAGDTDVLLLLSPDTLEAKELFAVDQYLMRGGTVIACTSPFTPEVSRQDLRLEKAKTGLEGWLKHFGVEMTSSLVLDTQCAALPVPVTRYVGGYPMKELRLLEYPYFVDVRESGLDSEQAFLSDLGQLTLPWASPIKKVEPSPGSQLTHTPLIKSSPNSWLDSSTLVMPQVDGQGRQAITPSGIRDSHILGMMVSGSFSSYFESESGKELGKDLEEEALTLIPNSPDSAKLIILSSPNMFGDDMVRMMASLGAGDALSNLTLVANLVDWSTEDESLLTIRSRSHFKRTLYPLNKNQQMVWESVNYLMALLILVIIGLAFRFKEAGKRAAYSDFVDRKEIKL